MNRFLIAVFTAAVLCGSLLAQSPQPPSSGSMPPEQQAPSAGQQVPPSAPAQATAPASPASNAPRIAPGSVIPVQLTKSIDAKKAKKGDEVVAKVTQDMRDNGGAVVVPKDTKVVGHVTEAEARSKEQKESQVAIAFDRAVLKNGEQMQMPMSIQAIIAPPNRNPANAEPPSGYPGPEAGGAPMPGGGGGRSGSMGGNYPTPSAPPTSGSAPTGAPASTHAQPPITGNTQGVVGIPNLKLSAASDPAQGSVVSSEKNNVKLDDGTFLLLRVNQ
jgi:type F conjugative transfer system protein TrbI